MMEKGKAKASGSQGKMVRTKSKGDHETSGNYKSEHAPQASRRDERVNNQLSTYQDPSRSREGGSLFGRDMLDDPFFNDPFFTRPFGEPFKSTGLFGAQGILNQEFSEIGQKLIDQFPFNNTPSVFQNGKTVPLASGHRGGERNVQIEELGDDAGRGGTHSSNQEPIIEHPDDDDDDNSSRRIQRSAHFNSSQRGGPLQPPGDQGNSYSFYSSSVMRGGSNGPIYAAQTTRRQGPNGVIEEEYQEKDSTLGRAHHRVSHGVYDKGHSLIRERKGDGQEERFETLHNLAQEEVPHFENGWARLAEQHLPPWPSHGSGRDTGSGSRSRPALPPGTNSRNISR